MWWRLSTAPGSDPATKPSARAVTHKARWASEAEFQFSGSAMDLRGVSCVLHPPNIFPEWPDEASDYSGTSVSLIAHTSHQCQIALCQEILTQIHREEKNKKGHHTKCRLWGCKSLLLFSTELANPQQRPRRY